MNASSFVVHLKNLVIKCNIYGMSATYGCTQLTITNRMKPTALLSTPIIFLFFAFLNKPVFAQTCNCGDAFKWAVKAFEENDAGFQYIIDQKGMESYKAHNHAFEIKLTQVTNPDSCVKGIAKWAKFFRVGHFGFIVNQTSSNKNFDDKSRPSTFKIAPKITLDRNIPSAAIVDSITVVLRIPTFNSRYKKAIDSVIKSNDGIIKNHKNLIIDITNNGGGDDRSFAEIIPYLYTNPIRNVSVARLSTLHNNQFWEDQLKQPNMSETDKSYYVSALTKLKANLGKFVVLNDSVYTTRYSNVYRLSQHVAILINDKNGSTAEQFLLAARQSNKTKLFGITTMGELDISNMYSITSPNGKYTLWYCMSKSLRIPEYTIDNKGLSPDYFLDKSIPPAEWVTYVTDLMHQW